MTVYPLTGAAQSYDWGAIGDASKVAHYAQAVQGFEYDASKPYAELWMGTHPSLPSKVTSTGQALSDLIKASPEQMLGAEVRAKFQADDLPYLFKVLSIGKALSIQAHPDKQLGKKLHEQRPDVYKDPNHKPEMAIALTYFSGFCGFRPLEEISSFLSSVPEFAAVVGQGASQAFTKAVSEVSDSKLKERCALNAKDGQSGDVATLQSALKQLFKALMEADAESTVKPQLRKLVQRYQKETGKTSAKEMQKDSMEELVCRLNEQFPDDIGCFCSFLLNVVKLQPGQACFLEANEPHAYLEGHIMECMATSDNVVRAGLTPKLRDVPTLVDMLTYTWGGPSTQLMSPSSYPEGAQKTYSQLYNPPIEEFSVVLTDLISAPEGAEQKLPAVKGPSILIFTKLDGAAKLSSGDGQKEITKEGQLFFVPAGTEIKLEGKCVAYTAFVEA